MVNPITLEYLNFTIVQNDGEVDGQLADRLGKDRVQSFV